MTSKAVFRSAVILILLGLLVVLGALTNPVAISMATGTLLIAVVTIAIASFAGLWKGRILLAQIRFVADEKRQA
jgi:hypothetical protein